MPVEKLKVVSFWIGFYSDCVAVDRGIVIDMSSVIKICIFEIML